MRACVCVVYYLAFAMDNDLGLRASASLASNSSTVLLVSDEVVPQQQVLLTRALPCLVSGGYEVLAELIEPVVYVLG